MIDIDIRGDKEIKGFLKELGSRGMKTLNDELYRIALSVRNDILKSMHTSPGGGRVYSRGGVLHIASLPYFPPRIDTGNLANRIFVDKGIDYSKVYTENVDYAEYLEKGTSKMKPRPFFEPAIKRAQWQRRIKNRILAERFAGRTLQ